MLAYRIIHSTSMTSRAGNRSSGKPWTVPKPTIIRARSSDAVSGRRPFAVTVTNRANFGVGDYGRTRLRHYSSWRSSISRALTASHHSTRVWIESRSRPVSSAIRASRFRRVCRWMPSATAALSA